MMNRHTSANSQLPCRRQKARKYAIAPSRDRLDRDHSIWVCPSHAIMLLVQIGVRLVAKFIIGVIVGISLGASATAYGADTSRSDVLSGWVTEDGEVSSSLTDSCRRQSIEVLGKRHPIHSCGASRHQHFSLPPWSVSKVCGRVATFLGGRLRSEKLAFQGLAQLQSRPTFGGSCDDRLWLKGGQDRLSIG
jgi:hypothetical protein